LRMLWKDKNWQKRLLFWLLFEELHNANRLSQMPPLYRTYTFYTAGGFGKLLSKICLAEIQKRWCFSQSGCRKNTLCVFVEREVAHAVYLVLEHTMATYLQTT
jgi:hypothetical protein